MAHPRHRLHAEFQTPLRLSLMAVLGPDTELDFGTLRDLLESTDSALSKALTHLEAADYVAITKGFVGARPRTWVRSTLAGRLAYQQHLRALREITGIDDVQSDGTATTQDGHSPGA